MTATSNLVSGFAGNFSGPGEYAFARRLRHRMLLSYLSQQRLFPTFHSMVQQTDAYMCRDHLQRLVSRGQWGDAMRYLGRFNLRKSVASNTLHFFLYTLWALANVAASERNGSIKATAHHHAIILSSVLCRRAKLCSIIKAMLVSPGQCVVLESIFTRIQAAVIADNLASEDPDLNRLMQRPGDDQMLPNHALPIIPRPRRQVKRPPGRRVPGPAIAKLYLNKRRSLLHSSSPNITTFVEQALDRVAGLVDECIKAGND